MVRTFYPRGDRVDNMSTTGARHESYEEELLLALDEGLLSHEEAGALREEALRLERGPLELLRAALRTRRSCGALQPALPLSFQAVIAVILENVDVIPNPQLGAAIRRRGAAWAIRPISRVTACPGASAGARQ
jgi:hypothetical protein